MNVLYGLTNIGSVIWYERDGSRLYTNLKLSNFNPWLLVGAMFTVEYLIS